ncbi:MAG: glycoside hydrolase family 127 protein [Caldilineaceae bacterium]
MQRPHLSTIAPRDVTHVGGFLGQRFHANRTKRLKDRTLSEEFIRLHEKKNYDDWFWMGEQIGKWIDAAAYAGLIADDQELLDRVNELIDRLAASQEANGYLGITATYHRNPVRGMELYEMYYVLLGLIACYDLLGNDAALKTAERLGDFIIQTWGVEPGQFPLVGPYPGNGHDGGEGTLILEPIVLLGGRTGQDRFVRWAEDTLAKWDEWWENYPPANHTCGYSAMRAFAAGEMDVYDLRENMHAHTYHMTLLGIAALYNVTGKQEYRDVVAGSVDRLADEWIFLTGGMSSTERYVPPRYYHARNQIEVCPQHTWILLLDQMLQWTGDARYAAEIERDLLNHFLAAQLVDGSNWSYFTPLNGHAVEPTHPNCCNAAGHRITGRMPTYFYGLRNNAPAVLMYSESGGVLRPEGLPAVTLRQETNFPASGNVTIHVDPESAARFALHLRIPPYAAGASARIGDETVHGEAGDFLVIEREWQPGDRVEVDFALRSHRAGRRQRGRHRARTAHLRYFKT